MKIFLTHTVVVIMILAGTSPALSGALHMAAQEGHTEIVKALLAAGAAVNAKDQEGRTALDLAAQEGHTETVKALLAADAAVNTKDDLFGSTALELAAAEGHTGIVRLLKAAGGVRRYGD